MLAWMARRHDAGLQQSHPAEADAVPAEEALAYGPEAQGVPLPVPSAAPDPMFNATLAISCDPGPGAIHDEHALERGQSHCHDEHSRHKDGMAQTQLRFLSLRMIRFQVVAQALAAAVLAYGANKGLLAVAIGGFISAPIGAGVTASLESAAISHLRLRGGSTCTHHYLSQGLA